MFILSFSISFVCLVVILLILCVIPLWDSATAHSPSGKAQPFLSGRWPFFRALHVGIKFSLHPALSLFGTQQQVIHPPAKSSTFPLMKMPVFQSVAHRHTISLHPASSLFGTQQQFNRPPVKSSSFPLCPQYLILCVVYFYSERPPLCRGV